VDALPILAICLGIYAAIRAVFAVADIAAQYFPPPDDDDFDL
jgi:hypothetical protein